MNEVLVVPTDVLSNIIGGHFQGFKLVEPIILYKLAENAEWYERGKAEKDPTMKQIICYCAFLDHKNWVFAYSRSKQDKDYPEKRLQGKVSWGIGGHITQIDGRITPDIFITSLTREKYEEVEIIGGQGITKIKLAGVINDDEDDVGKVHFGLFFMVHCDAITIKPKDPEIAIGRPVHPDVLKFACEFPGIEVEGWSRICQPEILRLLKE